MTTIQLMLKTITLILLLFSTLVQSSELDKSLDALERGDFQTAYNILIPLANQGDAIAQNNIGVMFEDGMGVPQDDNLAANWYRKAAEQGYKPYVPRNEFNEEPNPN